MHPSPKVQSTRKTWGSGENFLAELNFEFREKLINIYMYIYVDTYRCMHTQPLAYSFPRKP